MGQQKEIGSIFLTYDRQKQCLNLLKSKIIQRVCHHAISQQSIRKNRFCLEIPKSLLVGLCAFSLTTGEHLIFL